MSKPSEHWPVPFLDVVAEHLIDKCYGFEIEEQDAENDCDDAVFYLRHNATGLLVTLRVPASPSFNEAQEWCLGFLSRPLHQLLTSSDRRSWERRRRERAENAIEHAEVDEQPTGETR